MWSGNQLGSKTISGKSELTPGSGPGGGGGWASGGQGRWVGEACAVRTERAETWQATAAGVPSQL